MVNLALMGAFIPTFLFVSVTPGMCMTLAMTLGMSQGVRRTLWMMWGEMLGVALVAMLAVLGVAAIMLQFPTVFQWFKIVGACYLAYIGLQMWRAKGKLAIPAAGLLPQLLPRRTLFSQGFITAVSNPKGWAFHMALLPPFIDTQLAFWPQLVILISIIVLFEFLSMLLYASGGKALALFLTRSNRVQYLNRIGASLMFGVALWMVLG
ncbi:Threonine/homoserine/homoserine lactone efflux protein [Arsukibacterium tuosuense]|uniref:Threonine/homoserine/homoserine lactone efflux protein n=1 Tax=Arsukibacterium tuosuense TaxID=1323745 RepID=A0A285IW39_9GAMM|nr:LysE family translocator [Arsukibacterium tuosuense]SNY52255.1 Threonine/homoserine/homoserine lactone efflux protein [Arsukibacterium tuosuense]